MYMPLLNDENNKCLITRPSIDANKHHIVQFLSPPHLHAFQMHKEKLNNLYDCDVGTINKWVF